MTDSEIVAIRDEHLPSQGEPFDCIAFARSILAAAARQAQDNAKDATAAARDVLTERERQVSVEDWTPEHDDAHSADELALAAVCYALPDSGRGERMQITEIDNGRSAGEYNPYFARYKVPTHWPLSWAGYYWKPTDRRRDLVKAGALILAEIERLDRAAITAATPGKGEG